MFYYNVKLIHCPLYYREMKTRGIKKNYKEISGGATKSMNSPPSSPEASDINNQQSMGQTSPNNDNKHQLSPSVTISSDEEAAKYQKNKHGNQISDSENNDSDTNTADEIPTKSIKRGSHEPNCEKSKKAMDNTNEGQCSGIDTHEEKLIPIENIKQEPNISAFFI
ncbi:Enolase [Frankliniella fusca]|uniref:Enolase n=1 Tax=Frankliniella fusca TaxID=407009 RepID=A0AAE1HM69_9NEOP|nr:Enolase [Frankliniella fusca]